MGNNHTSKNKRCSSTERTPRFVNFNCDTLTAKLYPIEKDYFFTNKAVGNGMNGNVLLIERKSDHKRFALKVTVNFNTNSFQNKNILEI